MPREKEKKNVRIAARLTEKEKALVDAYCEKYDIKISDLVRTLIKRELGKDDK